MYVQTKQLAAELYAYVCKYREEEISRATSLTKVLEIAKVMEKREEEVRKQTVIKGMNVISQSSAHEDLIMCIQSMSKER